MPMFFFVPELPDCMFSWNRSPLLQDPTRPHSVPSGPIFFPFGVFLENQYDLKPDLIFLSPPWGGPNYYTENESFKLENMYVGKLNGFEILEKALEITPNVIYFLPKNTDLGLIQNRIRIPWEVMT